MSPEAEVKAALCDYVVKMGGEAVFEFWVPRSNERADLAAIGSSIDGFEIKTSRDTLKRLPRQAEAYARIFDTCHAVVAERHVEHTIDLLPEWWGVLLIDAVLDGYFVPLRKSNQNELVDPETLVRLLWRDEAYDALCAHGVAVDPGLGRSGFWQLLLVLLDIETLRTVVRTALLRRDASRARIPSKRFIAT